MSRLMTSKFRVGHVGCAGPVGVEAYGPCKGEHMACNTPHTSTLVQPNLSTHVFTTLLPSLRLCGDILAVDPPFITCADLSLSLQVWVGPCQKTGKYKLTNSMAQPAPRGVR